jgi:hypothetical protein
MHLLPRAKNGVHGAGLNAERAADTQFFVDDRDQFGFLYAPFRIERLGLPVQEIRQRTNSGLSAGRAPVDIGISGDNGLRVRSAARIAALAALGLRQQLINPFHYRVPLAAKAHGCKAEQQAEQSGKGRDGDNCSDHGQPFTSPAKPMKARAIIPAVIRAIEAPWNAWGTSAAAILSRTPAKRTITRENPSAAPKP